MLNFVSELQNGIHVHVLPTSKFKLNTIVVTFHTDLEAAKVTSQAMLPHVLLRGSQQHPTAESIQLALSDLYGATLAGTVSKKGERQIVEFLFKIANETYLKQAEPLLENGFSLLAEVLFQPVQEAGGFKPDFVEKEKEQHAKRIDSLLDDKIVYAAERCLEEMTKGERFSIPKLGRKSDLAGIDGKNLFSVYQELVQTAPMHVYVVGNVQPEQVIALVQKYFPQTRTPRTELLPTQTDVRPQQVKEIVERLDVNQGKLNIGLRTKVTHADDTYPALLMYNGVLGGFPHSKLFVNVREKASLAYYASSRLESYKGILYIQSGIQIENYEKALEIIKKQLEEMKNGNITDTELEFTKNGLINSFRTILDSPENLVDIHTGGLVSGRQRTVEELIRLVQQVTKQEVVQIANQVQLDTVYFLRDKKEVAAHA
ncbi:EF-P 5-aminopentanol modification-associated protein YfmF [Effusibacillus pohliae]|uniref:EF-P 5-aminopentanol modification-associated protein YfmF n=1 Tax=Effusibacillus pohliae TaxID=232270 RepID=UPI000370CAE3|nr:pitrilysin family protein [Effusibacillus pohliae]